VPLSGHTPTSAGKHYASGDLMDGTGSTGRLWKKRIDRKLYAAGWRLVRGLLSRAEA